MTGSAPVSNIYRIIEIDLMLGAWRKKNFFVCAEDDISFPTIAANYNGPLGAVIVV